MTCVTASAPGKLFLLGEYAVLHGAPALLTAVDRRVQVSISARDHGPWRVSAPALQITNLVLENDGSVPTGIDASTLSKLRVFDAVRREVARLLDQSADVQPLAGLDVTIDSDAFWHHGHKLGLGSSAAVAAALTAAFAAAAGLGLDPRQVLDSATRAHRAAQSGAGSGGDVAASCTGGLLSFSRGAEPIVRTWPEDLNMSVVVTGAGSSSTELVGRVAAYAERDPSGHRADMTRLADLARQTTSALSSTDAFMALADSYFEAIQTLDRHVGAGIVRARHRELHAVAARHGGVFKTSGAGGGDVGLVFARRGRMASEVDAALRAAGADVVSLGFGADGVRVDQKRECAA